MVPKLICGVLGEFVYSKSWEAQIDHIHLDVLCWNCLLRNRSSKATMRYINWMSSIRYLARRLPNDGPLLLICHGTSSPSHGTRYPIVFMTYSRSRSHRLRFDWLVLISVFFLRWMSPAALDLAEQLLAYDPLRRINAVQAMETPYFTQEAPSASLPTGYVAGLVSFLKIH